MTQYCKMLKCSLLPLIESYINFVLLLLLMVCDKLTGSNL